MECLSLFIDKKGREIKIGFNDSLDSIIACHDDSQVAVFRFQRTELSSKYQYHDDQYMLDNANVNSNYQRAGIGTQMIIEAKKRLGEITYSDHLSFEGAALLNSCVAQKIIVIVSETGED